MDSVHMCGSQDILSKKSNKNKRWMVEDLSRSHEDGNQYSNFQHQQQYWCCSCCEFEDPESEFQSQCNANAWRYGQRSLEVERGNSYSIFLIRCVERSYEKLFFIRKRITSTKQPVANYELYDRVMSHDENDEHCEGIPLISLCNDKAQKMENERSNRGKREWIKMNRVQKNSNS